MRRADFGKHGRDAAPAQALSVWLGTVASIALDDFRLAQRASALSANGRNCLDQSVKLRDVGFRAMPERMPVNTARSGVGFLSLDSQPEHR
ncbi:hypothetical protein CBM2587_A50003 [Cupriavidus taiwanensis]|uniref:Uncharacterized protein n=1 Tax=Cupriavidus taiwanensis TaxID=164546 RepID=A0A975X2Y3_9BURK|nr:hypothetical protein CBM2587_A50003 [Cupriavidus taiwanensis]